VGCGKKTLAEEGVLVVQLLFVKVGNIEESQAVVNDDE